MGYYVIPHQDLILIIKDTPFQGQRASRVKGLRFAKPPVMKNASKLKWSWGTKVMSEGVLIYIIVSYIKRYFISKKTTTTTTTTTQRVAFF